MAILISLALLFSCALCGILAKRSQLEARDQLAGKPGAPSSFQYRAVCFAQRIVMTEVIVPE